MTVYTLDQLAAVVAREHKRVHSKDYEWHCGLCNEMVTALGEHPVIPSIGCDECNTWFCKSCVGLMRPRRLPKNWYCTGCTSAHRPMTNRRALSSHRDNTINFAQRRPSSGASLPPRKRHTPSDADETGATLDDEPTTSLPPPDDETSPLE